MRATATEAAQRDALAQMQHDQKRRDDAKARHEAFEEEQHAFRRANADQKVRRR